MFGVLAPFAAIAQDAGDARPGAVDAGAVVVVAADGGVADGEGAADGGVADGRATTDTSPALPPLPLAPLQGTVYARGGHRRLPSAYVFVDGVSVAETDAKGRFSARVAPGRHRLQVTAAAHAASDAAIDVPPDGWSGDIRLEAGGSVQETVVAGKRAVAAIRVDGEEARTTTGTGGDPFRVIESLPGVSQISWPLALYAIRGGNPGNTGFFLDGMRVPALFHFALGPSIVHPYMVDKLSFYPGGYPARLGGYVSGAISAETGAPPRDTTRIAVDVRSYDAGGLAAAPWDGGRGTVVVAARYSYTGLIVSRLFDNVSFGYADYQLRADHSFAGGRLTLLTLGSFDTLNIREERIGDASLNFHRQDLRWERPAGGGQLFMRVTTAIDDAHSMLYQSPIDVRSYGVASRLAYSRPVGGGVVVEAGAETEAQRFRTDVTAAVAGGLSPTPMPTPQPSFFGDLARPRDALTAAAYLSASASWKRLTLDPGLRYSQYFEQGTTRGALQPRLAVRVGLTERLAADATVGRFAQMPSLPIGVGGFEAFGLRDLGLQTSTQAALSLEVRLAGDLNLRVTGFHQWLFVSDLRSTIARDVREPEFLQMRHGRGYGGELMLRVPRQARVHGWLAYTLSWSLRDFDGVAAASDWDQRHIVNLVTAVRLGRGYTVGGRFHYNTGRPYPVQTPLETVEYQRLPAYWQIDLRADKRVVFDRYTLDIYLELGNATLTRQVTAYAPVDSTTAPPRPIGFQIVLPSLGIHAEW